MDSSRNRVKRADVRPRIPPPEKDHISLSRGLAGVLNTGLRIDITLLGVFIPDPCLNLFISRNNCNCFQRHQEILLYFGEDTQKF